MTTVFRQRFFTAMDYLSGLRINDSLRVPVAKPVEYAFEFHPSTGFPMKIIPNDLLNERPLNAGTLTLEFKLRMKF